MNERSLIRGHSWREWLFALIATAAALLLFRDLFLPSKPGIRIGFELEYENPTRNHWQIFYTTGEALKWVSLPRVPLGSGRVRGSVFIPEESLFRLRLDLGETPGAVKCRDLLIEGDKKVSLDSTRTAATKQLTDLVLHPDGLSCSSSGNDPYISLELNEPLRAGRFCEFDAWAFWIVLVSAFIVSFALAGIVASKFREKAPRDRIDGVFLLLLAAAAAIPASRMDDSKYSQKERRKLAEYRPPVGGDGKIDYHYGRNFDAWFDDHFRGRPELLKFNSILLSVFKFPIQTSGKVYCGSDGWYFYSGNNSLRNYHNLDLFPEKQLRRAEDDLKAIAAICAKRRKKLYLVIVPDKHKIYGEYFPGSPKIHPDSRSRARQFERRMNENVPGVGTLYLGDALLRRKGDGPLFWKGDTHWNEMGAYVGYLEIADNLRRDLPDLPLCRISEIAVLPNRSDNFLYDWFDLPDRNRYPIPVFDRQYSITDGSTDVLYSSCHMVNPRGRHRLLLLRDSFSILLLPYLGNSFRTIDALWNNYRITPDRLDLFDQADVVIFECVERLLPRMLHGIHATRIALEQRGG